MSKQLNFNNLSHSYGAIMAQERLYYINLNQTIIEALRVSATGQMPPNSDKY